jgi:2-dehydropantoate 2-reductase
MQIVILGAGAMGCVFAARLALRGESVTLVDVDDARLAALNRDGITFVDHGDAQLVPIRAARAEQIAAPVDLVMLFTKGMHSAAAARSAAHLAGPETWALTLQNGIGNAELLADVFAPERVLMGVTDFPADLDGPTRVEQHGEGRIYLGGFTPAAHLGAERIATTLSQAGLGAKADAQIEVAMWEKVAFNAALNSIAMITELTVGGMDVPAGRRIAGAVVAETVAVANARGIMLARANVDAKVAFALAHHRGHKASMLQDRLAGRPTEIDTINGAIVRAGEAAGVPTPVTGTLADLVRLIEARGREATA